ncbi:DUF1552 domain-containing protein [Planctomicrobium sp. SH668]|uniref:DUF1552 domain-containing protein n=1 Tax=Planctomicrobium sp. SH668 TaxID=3448126 RepID=UPI003F5C565D
MERLHEFTSIKAMRIEMNKATVSRRHFLRGAGISLSLPALVSLAPKRVQASTSESRPPVRMGCLFFPNGVWRDAWIPKENGTDFTLPFSLEPLESVRSSINIISNTDKRYSHDGDGHYAKNANFLTGLKVEKTTGRNVNVGGISLDQLVAQKLGAATPLPSLELGIDPVISGIDSNGGYTRLYGSNISWQTPNRPVAKEIHPRRVYERLFGLKNAKVGNPADANDRRKLLDLALTDAHDLRRKLCRDDQFKLDEYLDSVRSVERQVEYFQNAGPRDWSTHIPDAAYIPPPHEIPGDYPHHVKLMLDMMILAFWSDSTRVSTFMFANDPSVRSFSFVDGVRSSHHELSHHEGKEDKIEQYKRIVRWHVAQLAYMCERMQNIPEGNGTLLDHSMILMGCGMSDGNSHDPRNLPIILAGKGNGSIVTGRHLKPKYDTPLCNLYLDMLHQMGIEVDSFGDSTGGIPDLTLES